MPCLAGSLVSKALRQLLKDHQLGRHGGQKIAKARSTPSSNGLGGEAHNALVTNQCIKVHIQRHFTCNPALCHPSNKHVLIFCEPADRKQPTSNGNQSITAHRRWWSWRKQKGDTANNMDNSVHQPSTDNSAPQKKRKPDAEQSKHNKRIPAHKKIKRNGSDLFDRPAGKLVACCAPSCEPGRTSAAFAISANLHIAESAAFALMSAAASDIAHDQFL